VQADRERTERAAAEHAADEDEARAHARRAERAAYLRGKLDEQAESVEDAGGG
jgi:cob(I)alamin adenosyltransferase